MVFENANIINPNPIEPNKIGQSAVNSPFKPDETKSFKEIFSKYVNDVNTMQHDADTSITKLATGEIKDVHQVMTAVAEAEVSFKMMMEIRHKLVSAYKDLIKTNV